MDFASTLNSVEKLNTSNYGSWSTRIQYYFLDQELWDTIGGSDTAPPIDDEATKRWKVKAGKAMYALTGETKRINIKEVNDNNRQMEKCYNCRKKGHYAKDCWYKKAEGNVATSSQNQKDEEEVWDFETSYVVEETNQQDKEGEIALATVSEKLVDYEHDWITDSRCSNHMTGDEKKLINVSKYKGDRVVETTNNSKISITHIGKTVFMSYHSSRQVELQNVYYVPGKEKYVSFYVLGKGEELPESQRADAVSSMVYEANARVRDPVYGCAGSIFHLQKQVSDLQVQLAKAQAQVVNMQCQQAHLLELICMEMGQSPQAISPPQQSLDNFTHNIPMSFLDDDNSGSVWEALWT
ncbi:hypothetical protein H5410_058639 [Solanum commersonii]|uniref:CCHC-type domain-containing protein n=1 Tax=Solanum commersonii TaxID=4109 RepID=A0A9J5WRP3_SOLCO|nr:hypothetical protein H5410_058639 [Solanum commersonii]